MSEKQCQTKECQTTLSGATEPCRLGDCPKFDLRDCDWKVQGHSRAGERTGYFIHGPQICIDCGLSTWYTMNAVFMTHRHTDHSLELANMISARQQKRKGQEHLTGRPVVMPSEAVPMIAHLCASVAWLSDGTKPESDAAALERIGIHPMPVEIGQKITVPGLPNIRVEIHRGYHAGCQSVGYGFIDVRNRLKSEFAGLKGDEIGRLRKSGVSITEEVEIPQVLIYGDTTPDALANHDEWKKYPNIFIECTAADFRTDPAVATAEVASRRERGHTHINELLPLLERFSEGRRWFIQHLSLASDIAALRAVLTASKVKDWTLVLEE